jgi:hypothetical protein
LLFGRVFAGSWKEGTGKVSEAVGMRDFYDIVDIIATLSSTATNPPSLEPLELAQNLAGTCTVRVYTLQMLPLGSTPTDILHGDSRKKTTLCCLPQLCCLPLCIADIRIIRTATRQPFLVFQTTKVLSEVAGKF